MNILTYLKNKHKNVIVITHRNEIKDFADNIIEVLKVKQGLTQEVIDANPEAGVTKLNII
jgi:DNA repair exonuclease SbcCD ATPase subunit